MKTAKEWAYETVTGAFNDGGRWSVRLVDEADYVPFEPQQELGDAVHMRDDVRGIIERLVERVQADARAPLEEEIARLRQQCETMEGVTRRVLRIANKRVSALKEEIARLRAENEKMRSVVLAARNVCVAMDWDMNRPAGHASILVDAIEASGMGYDE